MRLIDADALELDIQDQWEQNEISNGTWIDFRETLKRQPTIDAVEVVRCRECKWWNGETHGCIRNPSTEPWWETDYCSYGERRQP